MELLVLSFVLFMASNSSILLAQRLQPKSTVTINVDACNPTSQNAIDTKSVTIPVGGTVNWTNNDNIAHQTISGTAKEVSNVFDTGYINAGEGHTVVFCNKIVAEFIVITKTRSQL